MTKLCSKCKIEKSLEDFHFKNQERGTRNSWCKLCALQYRSIHFKTHRTEANLYNRNVRYILKAKINEYLLNHPCVDCGEKDIIVLEFDHVRGKKVSAVSSMIGKRGSWEKIFKEIEKCEVRCANCHRRITHNRRHKIGA